jgi:hypothetical protein
MDQQVVTTWVERGTEELARSVSRYESRRREKERKMAMVRRFAPSLFAQGSREPGKIT